MKYLASVLLPGLLLAACRRSEPPRAPEPVRVVTHTVGADDTAGSQHYSGTVEAGERVQLSFALPGTIRELRAEVGQRVPKGACLGQVDSETSRSALQGAQATLHQAEDAYRRTQKLYEQGTVTALKWVEVQTKLDQARSAVAMAESQLAQSRLYAPFAGVIAEKRAEAGQVATPGVPVVTLVSLAGLKVCISVPEADVAQLRRGQAAQVTVGALGAKRLAATVSEIGVQADALSRSYEVRLALSDSDPRLMPGMVADVSFTNPPRGEAGAEGYVVSPQAVQLTPDNRTFVWLNVGGKAAKRLVQTDGYRAGGVVVRSGLASGDRVVVEGMDKLAEGGAVR